MDELSDALWTWLSMHPVSPVAQSMAIRLMNFLVQRLLASWKSRNGDVIRVSMFCCNAVQSPVRTGGALRSSVPKAARAPGIHVRCQILFSSDSVLLKPCMLVRTGNDIIGERQMPHPEALHPQGVSSVRHHDACVVDVAFEVEAGLEPPADQVSCLQFASVFPCGECRLVAGVTNNMGCSLMCEHFCCCPTILLSMHEVPAPTGATASSEFPIRRRLGLSSGATFLARPE